MYDCCESFVFSGRGLCDGSIPRPMGPTECVCEGQWLWLIATVTLCTYIDWVEDVRPRKRERKKERKKKERKKIVVLLVFEMFSTNLIAVVTMAGPRHYGHYPPCCCYWLWETKNIQSWVFSVTCTIVPIKFNMRASNWNMINRRTHAISSIIIIIIIIAYLLAGSASEVPFRKATHVHNYTKI